MNVQGNLALLIRAGLRKEFRDNFVPFSTEYSEFLKVESTNLPEQSAAIITGPNRLYELGDAEDVTYEQIKMSPKVAGVDKEFGLGVQISKRTFEDDQYGKVKGAGKYLGTATRLTYEYRSAELLDDAFTGTTFKGVDGVGLCVSTHTYVGTTGTWSNTPTNQIGLSMAGITALHDIFMTMKDHNGDPAQFMMDTLLIGNTSSDYQKALQILGSDREPWTSNNADNAMKKIMAGVKLRISRYKTSAKSYFGIDSRWNDAHFVMRRAAQMEETTAFDNGAAKTKVTTRFLIWFVDPRGWAGINPA